MKKKLHYLYAEYPLRVHLVSNSKNLDIQYTPYKVFCSSDSDFPYPGGIDELLKEDVQNQYDRIDVLVCEDNMISYEDENNEQHTISDGWIDLKEFEDGNVKRPKENYIVCFQCETPTGFCKGKKYDTGCRYIALKDEISNQYILFRYMSNEEAEKNQFPNRTHTLWDRSGETPEKNYVVDIATGDTLAEIDMIVERLQAGIGQLEAMGFKRNEIGEE